MENGRGCTADKVGEAGGRVTANAIAPGFIRTKMTAGLALDKLEQVVPLGRMGEGSDIAGAARAHGPERSRR